MQQIDVSTVWMCWYVCKLGGGGGGDVSGCSVYKGRFCVHL